ncbi:MAG: TonB family protein [Thermodesulfobacteriota bacterium]
MRASINHAAFGVAIAAHAALLLAQGTFVPPPATVAAKRIAIELRSSSSPAKRTPAPAAKPLPRQEVAPAPAKPQPVASKIRQQEEAVPTPSLAVSPAVATEAQAAGSVAGHEEFEPSAQQEADYLALVRQAVERHKQYPLMARRQGRQGTAVVRLKINPSGALKDAHIVSSSGHAVLDQAAQDAVYAAAPFPAPAAHNLKKVRCDIPISFSIKL